MTDANNQTKIDGLSMIEAQIMNPSDPPPKPSKHDAIGFARSKVEQMVSNIGDEVVKDFQQLQDQIASFLKTDAAKRAAIMAAIRDYADSAEVALTTKPIISDALKQMEERSRQTIFPLNGKAPLQ